jgi:hypothetical protein
VEVAVLGAEVLPEEASEVAAAEAGNPTDFGFHNAWEKRFLSE